jgi:hypothetical protein
MNPNPADKVHAFGSDDSAIGWDVEILNEIAGYPKPLIATWER